MASLWPLHLPWWCCSSFAVYQKECTRLNLIAAGVRDAVQEAILSDAIVAMMMYTMVCVKGTPAVIIRPGEAGMKVWTMGLLSRNSG